MVIGNIVEDKTRKNLPHPQFVKILLKYCKHRISFYLFRGDEYIMHLITSNDTIDSVWKERNE